MENGHLAAYITGVGVVSPIGVGRKAFWSSLLVNESGVGPITLFDARDYEVRIAAECWDFDPQDFMDRKVAQGTDLFVQLGLAAAELALEDANARVELENKQGGWGSYSGATSAGCKRLTLVIKKEESRRSSTPCSRPMRTRKKS